jgi:hypothetical protein
MKVFAKKCNHAGSPAIVTAYNKLRKSGINAIYKAYRFYIYSTCTFRPGEKSRLNSMLNVITVMNSFNTYMRRQ